MIINDVIKIRQTVGTSTVEISGREYLTDNHNDTLVIMCHGIGERGPLEGTDLWKVEKLSGWPKYAKGKRPGAASETGYNEYPFNMFAVQVPSDYYYLLKAIIPAMKSRYNPKTIVLAGISLGCFGIYHIMSDNADVEIKAIVAICGASDRDGSIFKWPTVKGIAWHGDKDTVVAITRHLTTVSKYNEQHASKGGHIEFKTLPGVAHNAWDHAFKPNLEEDQSYQFILSTLGLSTGPAPEPEPTPEEIIAELQAQLSDLNTQVTELKAQKDALQSKILQIQSILQ